MRTGIGFVSGNQLVTSLGMHLDEYVSIDLRGRLGATAFLVIGDTIEITLGEGHVRSLRDQAAAALGDMVQAQRAEKAVGDADRAAAQALTAAELAREKADAARLAGAREQADLTEEAAGRAAEAAERAQVAVRAAVDAMGEADEAAGAARTAAIKAIKAAEAVGRVRSAEEQDGAV